MSNEIHSDEREQEEYKSSRIAVPIAIACFILLCCLCLLASTYILLDNSGGEEVGPEQAEDRPSPTAVEVEETSNIVSFGSEKATSSVSEDQELATETASAVGKLSPTISPTPIPTSGVLPTGASRANPYPLHEKVHASNWDIKIVEIVRGEEALTQLHEQDGLFTEPPPDGMTYLLMKISALSTYADAEPHAISTLDFGLTGSNLEYYSAVHILDPDMVLDTELLSGDETEGWIAFLIDEQEDNLILVFDELWNFNDDFLAFIAVDEGASIAIDPALYQTTPEGSGRDQTSPVAYGESVVTGNWELSVVDVVRGTNAWAMVSSANQFNDPPAPGMEYLALNLHVRNIDTKDRASFIDNSHFQTTGSSGIYYDAPFVVDPQPQLDIWLYPGGRHEGWLIVQVGEDEEEVLLKFEPTLAYYPTFFALE